MKQVFPIVPSEMSAWGTFMMVVPMLVLLAVVIGLAYFTFGARNNTFGISPEGLELKGSLYGRLIPRADLVIEEARSIDLRTEKDLAPMIRTNGIGMPGYLAGWVRLRNGNKGLAFLTDRSRVAYVPTRQGYAVLLSVASPAEFVEALRRAAPTRNPSRLAN